MRRAKVLLAKIRVRLHPVERSSVSTITALVSASIALTWDDHEVANNGYRDGFSGMNNTEASFLKFGRISVDSRKMNAVRAYFEWMPIRQVDLDDNLRIWRNFKMGKLFDLSKPTMYEDDMVWKLT
jgi:phosphodiesterase/alkaline phosphatase D-like protein